MERCRLRRTPIGSFLEEQNVTRYVDLAHTTPPEVLRPLYSVAPTSRLMYMYFNQAPLT